MLNQKKLEDDGEELHQFDYGLRQDNATHHIAVSSLQFHVHAADSPDKSDPFLNGRKIPFDCRSNS